jgi:hypothetical protein
MKFMPWFANRAHNARRTPWRARPAARAFRPCLEALEERALPSKTLQVIPVGNPPGPNQFFSLAAALQAARQSDVIQIELNSTPGDATGASGDPVTLSVVIEGAPGAPRDSLPAFSVEVAGQTSGVVLHRLNLVSVTLDSGSAGTIVRDDSIRPPSGGKQPGVLVSSGGTDTTSATVTDSVIAAPTSDGIAINDAGSATADILVEHNSIDAPAANGIDASAAGSSTTNLTVQDNLRIVARGIAVAAGAFNASGATYNVTVDNNALIASTAGGFAVDMEVVSSPSTTVHLTVANNTELSSVGGGITVTVEPVDSPGTTVTGSISGNSISATGDAAFGIHVETNDAAVCVALTDNQIQVGKARGLNGDGIELVDFDAGAITADVEHNTFSSQTGDDYLGVLQETMGTTTVRVAGNTTVGGTPVKLSKRDSGASNPIIVEPAPGQLTATGTPVTLTAGTPATVNVATFTDPAAAKDPNATTDILVTITWGDGQISQGTVTTDGKGNFTVSGTTTFAEVGTFPVTVTINDCMDNLGTTVLTTATVS